MDKWDQRFMELAGVIANWASCYKANRKVGAVIVKNKRIVTTGYNGAPAGIKTCVERGECLRQKLGIAFYQQGYPDDFALEMLTEGGVALERYGKEEQ